jgi:CheY-like chemotaxis protein
MREQHRLNIELKLDDTANPPSEEQRDVLFQAAQELLLNVVKHSGVSRAAMTLERSQDQVWIEVADKGKGADSTNLASQNSFGLFHLRQRLEAIGGTLIVEALEGSGTRVCVTLPMSTDASSNPQSSEHGTTPADVQVAGTGLIRVVLADDHPLVREGLLSLLRREPDIEVVGEAGDGRAAVDMVARLRPDVVLMDVSMPVLDGVEATRRVVSMSPDVRIIGLSLDAHPETARAMLDAGAVEFITKNSPRQQLVSTIRLVTGRLDNN